MATRAFTDRDGTTWLVWRVTPGANTVREYRPTTLPEELVGGWLCFESEREKRRMYPVPPEWEALADDKLDLLCRSGVVVVRRSAHVPTADGPQALHGGPA
jgi:hypothetical protein